jgi:hypothetical protein
VSRGQRHGSLRRYSRLSRPEPHFSFQVAPQMYSRGWVTTALTHWNYVLFRESRMVLTVNSDYFRWSVDFSWRWHVFSKRYELSSYTDLLFRRKPSFISDLSAGKGNGWWAFLERFLTWNLCSISNLACSSRTAEHLIGCLAISAAAQQGEKRDVGHDDSVAVQNEPSFGVADPDIEPAGPFSQRRP